MCAGLAKFRLRGIQLRIVGFGCGLALGFGSRFSVLGFAIAIGIGNGIERYALKSVFE
jgi:hypothetical protein